MGRTHRPTRRGILFFLLGSLVLLVGCGASNAPDPKETGRDGRVPGRVTLTSPAFSKGEPIPDRYTCVGEDVSPRLEVRDVADTAASLALIVDDPDAPGGPFVHWLIWNVPADERVVPEKLPRTKTLPSLGDARQGTNGFDVVGYRGPCPPPGSPHRYRFKLYLLDRLLELEAGAREPGLLEAMDGSVLDRDTLVGTYGR